MHLYYVITLLVGFVLFSIFYFFKFQIQSPKLNRYTISYYVFLFIFGIFIRKPLLNIFWVDLDVVNIYNILFLIVMLVTLTYFRSKLWVIFNYYIIRRIDISTPMKAKGGFALILFLPVDHTNSTAASRYWAAKSLATRNEARTLELVLQKIDKDQPLSCDTSRLAAFTSYITEIYSEALRYDSIARRNQYRKMIMSEPRFRENESFDISTILD